MAEIRPARADDAPMLAPLIRASAVRAFDYAFRRDAQTDSTSFIARCNRDRLGMLGWANHFVVVDGGELLASVALWTSARRLSNDLFLAPHMLAHFGPGIVGVVYRSLQVAAMLQHPRRGELYLGHLSVRPELRGRGTGKLLLSFAVSEAGRRGCRRILLDVADDNGAARRLYERVGYVERGHREFRGPAGAVPGHAHMVLEL